MGTNSAADIAKYGPVVFSEPHALAVMDMDMDGAPTGVGRQFAVGHTNTDGIMDICVASKLGLFVFLGQ